MTIALLFLLLATEPAVEPATTGSEPAAIDPVGTEPVESEPAATEPAESESAATEPVAEPEPAELPRLMVVDLRVEEGVSESAARLLNQLLLAKLQATRQYEVFGEDDIRSMLDLEKEKQLTGCSDIMCVAMIAGAMGAERSLFGSVGAIGDMYVLNLRLVNNKDVKVEARWSESFEGEEKELIAAVDRAVASLVPVESAAVAMEEDDHFYQTWWFWTLVGVGALGATAGIITATTSSKDDPPVGPMVDANVEVVLP